MIRRSIEQLAVYQVEKESEVVPFKCLYDLYLEKTADIVYITLGKRLYGIVAVNEILHPYQEGEIWINKNYTVLDGFRFIKAKEIFRRNRRIHNIPVVNEQGELLGDYSCWNDILYIEQNLDRLMQEKIVEKELTSEGVLYIVEPIEEKRKVYIRFIEYLDKLHIGYEILKKRQMKGTLHGKCVFIFIDEEEKRGTMCMLGIDPGRYNEYDESPIWYDVYSYADDTVKITTYKRILRQLEKESCWQEMKVNKPEKFICRKTDDKASYLLSEIQKKGIKCFCLLYENEKRESADYWKPFNEKLFWRLKNHPISLMTPWSKGEEDQAFYAELYNETDYEKGVAQREIHNGVSSFEYRVNLDGKYFNARNGRRLTCFQPENYVGTIYLMGMCMIVGRHVEDRFTISSYLQKILSEKGYAYRVENCGVITRRDAQLDTWIEKINRFRPDDIILYQSSVGEVMNTQYISTAKIFEKYQIPTEWVMDNPGHCNQKVNRLIADSLFGMIKQYLPDKKMDDDGSSLIHVNMQGIMHDYIQYKYIKRYFSHFDYRKYHTIGAIVMNCDPFHKGHRYIIEQAREQVDCLIVFIIRESRTWFQFEERCQMVADGVCDLKDIIVVPNGDFIFSENNFREYYVSREDEIAAINAAYDINIFADHIAEPLHITHRFVGKETNNSIMKVYNETMRRILPQKGIRYVEIPKMMQDGNIVKSSNIRRYIKREEYENAFKMIPESTKRYLAGQIGMAERDFA